MREYGKIATRVWTDARVLQLDAAGKLVWVYLLAGSQSNCVGCFRCTGHHLAADAICPAEGGEAALARLAELGLIERDPAAGLVWLPRWLRYNPLVNPNMGKGALMELLALPASPLLARVVESLRPFARLLPSDWEGQVAHLFPNPLGNGLGNGLANMSPIPIPSHPNPTHEEGSSPSGSPDVSILLKDGTTYQPTAAQLAEWRAAFPLVDVGAELRHAAAWCAASPERRKTRRGVARFAVGWLGRAKPTAPARPATPVPTAAELKAVCEARGGAA